MPDSEALRGEETTRQQDDSPSTNASPGPAPASSDPANDGADSGAPSRTGRATTVFLMGGEKVYVFKDRRVHLDPITGMVEIGERGGDRYQVTAPVRATVIEWALDSPAKVDESSRSTLGADES